MLVIAVTVLCLVGLAVGQESRCDLMPPIEAKLLSPGLRLAVPDTAGMTQVQFQYSINKLVPGVSPGDHSAIVTTATNGYFEFVNPSAEVSVGDTVNGWYQTIISGEGRDCLEQSWVAVDESNPPETTTTTTTTTSAPTPPPTTPPAGETTRAPTNPPTPPPATNRRRKYCNKYPCRVPAPSVECTEYPCLVFSDEFDFLDLSKWEHELTLGGGGNWEFQAYTNNRTNSYVRDGVLYLKPTLTEDKFGPGFLSSGTMDIWGAHPANLCTGNSFYGCMRVGSPDNYLNPIQSARVRTSNSFYTRYGRIETRARMPAGDWLWPAIWLLPRFEDYGNWPSSGEIDIVESRGNADLRDESGNQRGNSNGGSTLHWGPFFEANRYSMTHGDFDSNLASAFHDYAVEWNKDGLVFEVDGAEVLRVDPGAGGFWDMGNFEQDFPGIDNPWADGDPMAPFDKEFYIIMNVAVGGTMGFFPDGWTNAGYPKPWINTSPTAPREFALAKDSWYPTWNPDQNNGEDAAMAIEYVRVYKMSADDMST